MKNNLTQNIFIGFMLGVFFGVILNVSNLPVHIHNNLLVFLSFGGDVFLKTIKMLVVPIVFFSLVNGVANLRNIASLGRIGSKSILIYLLTTCIAITMSLFLANIIQPGQGFGRNSVATDIEITNPPSFFDILLNIIPNNPFASLVEGEMLQVILFSILIGSSISVLKNTMVIKKFFNEFNQVVMQILSFVMTIAPFGIFCLISKTFATQGLNSILELLKYFLLVAFVLFLHVFLIYLPVIKFYGKVTYKNFFLGIKDALLFSFSTSSSTATIPVTLNCLKKNFSIKENVAAFTVPLGATINMDGTAIMQGIATVFIANIYGIELLFLDYISIIITATLASIGTAGVPGVGIIMLGMVLNQVGLPLEGIAIVMGVDRFLDMLRTSVNISGDAMVSIVVNKGEK
ncbi:MAG: dicarboxylate/amino acid:cation symporter [Alphaproteobacteria bacterium]